MSFEPNLGQTDPEVRFLARGRDSSLFLTPTGAVILLCRPENSGGGYNSAAAVRIGFGGAEPSVRLEPDGRTGGVSSYTHAGKHIIGIPKYSRVWYRGLYPGVQAVFYGTPEGFQFDFEVAPGADAKQIVLNFEGVSDARLDALGDLVLSTPAGDLRQKRPRAFQRIRGGTHDVAARYIVGSQGEVRIETGPYDRTSPLIIDPVVLYSTLIGGSLQDRATAVAADTAGNLYVAGETLSADFPRTVGSMTRVGDRDVFVAKLDPTGTRLLYSTYIGGRARDSATALALDSAGSAYVIGTTTSADFPVTSGAYRSPALGLEDAFVVKLGPEGVPVYAAVFGGSSADFATSIALGSTGTARIAGYTNSQNFPVTPGAHQTTYAGGYYDAFVVTLDETGARIVSATYLGGAGNDQARGLALNASGEAYVVGYTDSKNFPIAAAFRGTPAGGGDAFLARLDAANATILTATYCGGRGADAATGIAIDAEGNVVLTGYTSSPDFPTANCAQCTIRGLYDAFAMRFNASVSSIIYSTFLGGGGSDSAAALALDQTGSAWIAGSTDSFDFPVRNAAQGSIRGGRDGFLAKVDTRGTVLFATYIGGAGQDEPAGISIAPGSHVYVVGATYSPDFPVTIGTVQPALSGGGGFIQKIEDEALGSVQLSGRITNGAGIPVAGVAVALSGSREAVVITGADGAYSFRDLPTGGSYVVQPSKPGYSFAPPQVSSTLLAADNLADFRARTATLTANPDTIRVCSSDRFGVTTLYWATTGVAAVEVRLGAPDGPLFAAGGATGSQTTGKWVSDGMTVFLQDRTGDLPLTPEHSLAAVQVHVESGPCSSGTLVARPNPIQVCDGSALGAVQLNWDAPGATAVQIRVGTPDGGLFVLGGPQGSKYTGRWVTDGMMFHLLDASGGTPYRTLASVRVGLTAGGCGTRVGTLRASPNPIPTCGKVSGATNLSWTSQGTETVEVHVGGPTGALFSRTGPAGMNDTGPWVSDGMSFYLQDVSRGLPLTSANTLAVETVWADTTACK